MELKRSYRTTDLAQRHRFVRLWLCGNSARSIAQQTGASATTVCRWIRRWKNEGHVNLRHHIGRPRKNVIWNEYSPCTSVSCPVVLWTPADLWCFRCSRLTNHRLSRSLGPCQRDKRSYILPSYEMFCFGSVLKTNDSAGGGLGFWALLFNQLSYVKIRISQYLCALLQKHFPFKLSSRSYTDWSPYLSIFAFLYFRCVSSAFHLIGGYDHALFTTSSMRLQEAY